jgi:NAD(P)-dependent dehydrogenase (short-subunit alcohol dehydrogenase family)
VEFAGKSALVVGPGGPLADAVTAAMVRNGAVVRRDAESGGAAAPDILVLIATGPSFDAAGAEPMLREACRGMAEGGRVVMVVSALGLVGAREEAAKSVRAAGLLALNRVLAMEFAPRRIAVNAAAVGPLAGEEGISARMVSHTPLKRGARNEEIVAAVLFLADPENSYMTGHVLAVDGGWTAGFARDF